MAVVGFGLALSSLDVGLSAIDDLGQRAFILEHLQGHGDPSRPWWDVYTFLDGNVRQAIESMNVWASHWWTWPGLKIRFWRPAAAITLYADYALFGDRHWLAHLHSAVWYAAACFSVTLLLLRLSRNRCAAMLGALLYTLDDAHAVAISWLACRNALMAVTFVAVSLVFYDRATRGEPQRWVALSVLCFTLALLSAEAAVSAIPMFVGHAMFVDRRRMTQKVGPLASILVTVVVWSAVYKWLGFGTSGAGSYLDPFRDGPVFWSNLPGRLLDLLHAQFAAPWPLAHVLPFTWLVTLEQFARWIVLPATAVFVLRSIDRDADVAFFSFSAAFGLIPVAAALPSERVLVLIGLALWMLVALLVVAVIARTRASARHVKVLATIALTVSFVMYIVLAPVALVAQARPRVATEGLDSKALNDDRTLNQRQLILINVPSLFTPYDIMAERRRNGWPLPARFAVLGATESEVEVTRVDAHSFELYSPPGYLLDPVTSHWRGPSVPLQQGYRISVQEYEVLVVRVTPDGRPLRVRFRFSRALEDPALRFMFWTPGGLVDFPFGAMGVRQIIPASYDHTNQLPEAFVR
jgi:hypothetical protein